MIEIRSVPASQFPHVYPLVARYFASFVERAHGGLMPGHLETEVVAGRAQVLVAVDGEQVKACALTSIAPNGAISIHYCAGEDRTDWQDKLMDAIEAQGVTVEVTCRPGWAPWLKKRGYRETHRVMERRANEQE